VGRQHIALPPPGVGNVRHHGEMQFDDVNVEWVSNELNQFVSETKPVGRNNSAYTPCVSG
jgi:hypothetical protein